MRLALAILAGLAATPALAGGLTVPEARYLLSASGFNPGATRRVGNRVFMLQSVQVGGGKRRGEFLVRVVVGEVRAQ